MAETDLLSIARTVALRAGELARQRRSEGVSVAATKSSLVDVVTDADRETEDLIRSLLAEARPDDGFLGEESGAQPGSSGLTWVVDPIDGTVNYLYGIPLYAVSIAVVEGEPDPLTWRALAGCVVNPALGEVYTASLGEGAHFGETRLVAPEAVELAQALIGTGFSYSAERRGQQGELVARLLPLVRDIRRHGVASLDLCGVATGRLNAYYESGLNPWDQAAGALIAREAGARVVGLGGAEPSSDFLIAGASALTDVLETALLRLGLSAES